MAHSHPLFSPERLAQDKRLKDSMQKIKNKIVVLSGKGGVGKSTVSANLAYALAEAGFKVGLLDADLHGPNLAEMLGVKEELLSDQNKIIYPTEINENLKIVSLALLKPEGYEAFIWRGPVKIGIIRQLLADVHWGELDFLIVDTPPGTGDEPMTVCQTIHGLNGAIIVTTPQNVSVTDAKRSIDFLDKIKTKPLGLIENMAGFRDKDGIIIPIFGINGGKQAAEECNIPFLGSIPIDPAVGQACAEGKSFMSSDRINEAQKAFGPIVAHIMEIRKK